MCVNVNTRTLLCVIVFTVSLAVYLNFSASLGVNKKNTFLFFFCMDLNLQKKCDYFTFKTSTELSGDNAGTNLSQ